MKKQSAGTGTRFDNDLGGNHVDRVRHQSRSLGVYLDYSHRWCFGCKQKQKVKGGSGILGKKWRCANCKGVAVQAERIAIQADKP